MSPLVVVLMLCLCAAGRIYAAETTHTRYSHWQAIAKPRKTGIDCHFVTNGHWPTAAPLVFHYDTSGSKLSDELVLSAMQRAIDPWMRASASVPRIAFLKHTAGTLRPSSHPYFHAAHALWVKGVRNGRNEIAFVRTNNENKARGEHALAETNVWVDDATQEIVEVDIVLHDNEGPQGFHWTDSPHNTEKHALRRSADLQSMLTCQFGHALGLGASNSHDHTMLPVHSAGDRSKNSLECGDLAGIRSLYP
jgi:hypothetical protein